ncbi:hypothetical protein BDA96_04G120800 [Sorghum bicolor]|uniref:Uncharacterized protein n=1 Tax=Sorghum bicolor TaxID=4558 RepID=A0A921R4X9_SORBI|nr:hypothetical protein BDA96_04G120800 [Sorghum bicolor]
MAGFIYAKQQTSTTPTEAAAGFRTTKAGTCARVFLHRLDIKMRKNRCISSLASPTPGLANKFRFRSSSATPSLRHPPPLQWDSSGRRCSTKRLS